MIARPEIVVTGIGTISAAGIGVEALRETLERGGPEPVEVDRSAGYHRPQGARTALLASALDLQALVPARLARRMSPPARYAVAATKLALDQGGLDDPGLHPRTGIVAGTAFGPSSVTEQLLHQIFRLGPDQASPAAFTESVASAAASQVALLWKAKGPSLAVTQREASDLVALGEGVRLLENRHADRVLVLVVDEMIPLLHAMLDRFRALARPDGEGRERALPFAEKRSGYLAAEGAAALLLEPRTSAHARGATPLATVAARVAAFDPTAPAHDWGTGAEALARALERGLARYGVDTASIGTIVSGASGSRRGDALESATLRAAWGDRPLPPIEAPKAALGEYGGAYLAAAVAIAGRARQRTLVTALATSGAAAWIVLDPP